MLGIRVAQAGLPVLDRPTAHARPRGELTLGQPGASAVAEQQTLKGLWDKISHRVLSSLYETVATIMAPEPVNMALVSA